jgi:hypothetical protein
MPILFLFDETRESTHGDAPVSMLRYSTVCFLVMTLVVLVALYVKSRWGLLAPLIVGYGGAVLSITSSALLFARYHARQLLPIERKRLTIGCFLVLWFYNDFLAIVSHSILTLSGRAHRFLTRYLIRPSTSHMYGKSSGTSSYGFCGWPRRLTNAWSGPCDRRWTRHERASLFCAHGA